MCERCGVSACYGEHCAINDLSPRRPGKFDAVQDSGGGGDSKKNSNPKDRLSKDRLDLSLFPVIASAYGALAMTEGGLKYGPYNWREPNKGIRASVYYAACRRHLDKWLSREWEDPDTGVPHLASALACIAIIIDATETDCITDDRPKFLDNNPECQDIFEGVMAMLTEKARVLHAKFGTSPPPAVTHPDAEPPGGKQAGSPNRDSQAGV